MARGKRRVSTSSVETVDENQIRWLQESSVLRTPSSSTPIDSLPIFELRDAVVLNKDGETCENALHVVDKGPYIVRGHLIIDDREQRSNLIMKVRSSVPLEIRRSVGYSIGETEEGRPVIWVQGKSAWYEIEPSPAYQLIYKKMCEATTLYYHIMGFYSAAPPKRSKKTSINNEVSQIFLGYAIKAGDGVTFEEVVEKCGEHAFFFFWQFTQEKPDEFDWKSTGFYKWLVNSHADVFDKAEKLADNPPKMSDSPPRRNMAHRNPSLVEKPKTHARRSVSAAITPEVESSDSDILPTRRVTKRTSPPKAPPAKTPPPKVLPPKVLPPNIGLASASQAPIPVNDVPQSTALQTPEVATPAPASGDFGTALQSIIDAVDLVYQETKGPPPKRLAAVTTVNKLYFAYQFPNYRDETRGSYRKPVEEIFHYNAKALVNALDRTKYEGTEFFAWLQELAHTPFESNVVNPRILPFRFVRRKQITRQPKHTNGIDGSREQSKDTDASPSTPPAGKRVPGQRSGKKSSLRLATSQKRSHAALESDSDAGSHPGHKRSHYFSDEDDEMEDAGGLGATDSAEEADPDTDNEPIKLFVQAERIPSTKPLGPSGTWTCEEDECDYVVRGGDQQEIQSRIQEHFQEHKRNNLLNLAVVESRGHLPIDHLLAKIKKLGERLEKKPQEAPARGVSLPQHIKRRLPM